MFIKCFIKITFKYNDKFSIFFLIKNQNIQTAYDFELQNLNTHFKLNIAD